MQKQRQVLSESGEDENLGKMPQRQHSSLIGLGRRSDLQTSKNLTKFERENSS